MHETRRAVLSAIEDGPVAGPDIAERLGVSRAAVWKHVEALREAGFRIESDGDGYRLVDLPEYGGPAIEHGLDAPFAIEYHASLPSTNDRARELAAEGAGETAVIADEQTGGRGRLDRAWRSPSGGIWMSVLLRPDLPASQVPLLTLGAAVAAARALEPTGVGIGLKWPNDLLVPGDERKLAGILTEMEGEADAVSWVVVGIGVNANVPAASLPTDATSLRAEVGDVDRRAVVQRLLEELHAIRGDPDAIIPAWRERSLTLGRRVRVEAPDRTVEGEAVDVEPPGVLVVDADGDRVRIHAGECEHLRPADGQTSK